MNVTEKCFKEVGCVRTEDAIALANAAADAGVDWISSVAPVYFGQNFPSALRHYLCARNDFRSAAKLQLEVNRLVDLVVGAFPDNWSDFKVLMKAVGIDCGYCRAPYAPLVPSREKTVLAKFAMIRKTFKLKE